jgi:hypothetical protein
VEVIQYETFIPSFDDLGTDEVANIFGFLPPEDIMRARVCRKMRDEVAKKTIVPMTDFVVNNLETYNAMTAMTTALPNLQQITLRSLDYCSLYRYVDGDDPDYEDTDNWTMMHEINFMSNFTRLRMLTISNSPLNGRYPFLFNFPLLQSLTITCCCLKWDLEMLAGLPLLKELHCDNN